ncbi:uncharacterized protein LOC134261306 [Saccostrea cucullata]|uniref:uncharacterized protein LOC134261306 n=1 Tax=Saccostrea cuccullata TaxID=36930 RepID=UPI002ED3C818
MIFLNCAYLWVLFAVVDSHSPLTEKRAEDGISVKSSCQTNEIAINSLQNQINQETLIRISLLKQVYSLVGDMINLKNEMAAMKTNTEEIRKSTDDLWHEDNKMLNKIAQMKQYQNDTSEIIINEQHEHDKMLSEIKQMKINQNDTSERIINYQREYEKTLSEIEQKMKFNHNNTSERIVKAQLEYKTMFSKLEQDTESKQDDTSERIVNIQNDILNVNNSVGLLHNYTDEINSKYGIHEKTVRDLVSELGKIQGRLGVMHNKSERIRSETQRMIVNYNKTTLKMREDLKNITSMVKDLAKRQVQECLESSHCLLQYSFEYDDIWNGCEGGRQYVKKTNYSTTPYLGVITCSSTRYIMFMLFIHNYI